MSKIKGQRTLCEEQKSLSQKKRQSLIPTLGKQLRNERLENLLEPICSELWHKWGILLFIAYDDLEVFLTDVSDMKSSEKYFWRVYPEQILENELRAFLFDKLVSYMALSEETNYRHFKKRKFRVRRFKALVAALQTSNKMAPFLFQWLLEFSYTLGREYKNRLEALVKESTIYHADHGWIKHLNGYWERAFRCGKHVEFEYYSAGRHQKDFETLNFTEALEAQDFALTFELVFADCGNVEASFKAEVKENVDGSYQRTLFDAAMRNAPKRWDDASRQEALDRLLAEKCLWCNLIYVYWMRQWLSVHEGRGYFAPLTVPEDVPFWGEHLFPKLEE